MTFFPKFCQNLITRTLILSVLNGLLTGCSGYAPPQDPTPGLVASVDSSSCKIWDPNPHYFGVFASWTGPCSNGVANGTGTLVFYSYNDTGIDNTKTLLSEEGKFIDGKPDGIVKISMNGNNPGGVLPSYNGKLSFANGVISGAGYITFTDSPDGVTYIHESDSFSDDVSFPAMGGKCSNTSTSPGHPALLLFAGECENGILKTGHSYAYFDDASKKTDDDGTFDSSGDPNGPIFSSGTETSFADNSLTPASTETGQFSRSGNFLAGTKTIYSKKGKPVFEEAGEFKSINNKTYLQGDGYVAIAGGGKIKGEWTDGCLNGKFPQHGFLSCAAVLASAKSDRIQVAQAAAQAQQQHEQQAEQQQQAAQQQAEQQQEAEAQRQQNVAIFGALMGAVAQGINQGEQNNLNISNQFHIQPAPLAPSMAALGAVANAASLMAGGPGGGPVPVTPSNAAETGYGAPGANAADENRLAASAISAACDHYANTPAGGVPQQREYYVAAAEVETCYANHLPASDPRHAQYLEMAAKNQQIVNSLSSNSPTFKP